MFLRKHAVKTSEVDPRFLWIDPPLVVGIDTADLAEIVLRGPCSP